MNIAWWHRFRHPHGILAQLGIDPSTKICQLALTSPCSCGTPGKLQRTAQSCRDPHACALSCPAATDWARRHHWR
jgi:hypothetical protein